MPGGRPTKPLALVQGHRTNAEKNIRKKAEASLLTGYSLRESSEVKSNPLAHKEFQRIKRLLKAVNKDDDLSGNIINTYCLLCAECKDFELLKERLSAELEELAKAYQDKQIEFLDYLDHKEKLQNRFMICDKKIMEKRKMILDISKENIMTIQSALRSIPKKPEDKQPSKMATMLERQRQAK